jgi:uncharacterized membrane protein YfcA
VVIALVAFPALPLDDVALGVLAIGVPIGFGIYLAWVDRDRPAGARRVGLVGSMAGALAGAWLGFHAGSGLLAVVTTIVGAALGANLVLLVLDSARARPTIEVAKAPQSMPTTVRA